LERYEGPLSSYEKKKKRRVRRLRGGVPNTIVQGIVISSSEKMIFQGKSGGLVVEDGNAE